jgi:hypothetical protein
MLFEPVPRSLKFANCDFFRRKMGLPEPKDGLLGLCTSAAGLKVSRLEVARRSR